MRPDAVIYVNGAFLPRFSVRGVQGPRVPWEMANITLTPRQLDIAGRAGRVSIPLASVRLVGAPPQTMQPPPVSMEQVLAIHHEERGETIVTMLAFPRVTVKNFPMQLAGALTGTVNAFVPSMGADGRAAYDPASFEFDVDRVIVRTRAGPRELPLESIATVSPARRRDQQGREFVEWTIDHVAQQGLSTLNLISYERTQFLFPLLMAIQGLRKSSALGRESRPSERLSETAQQVAVLLYTGGQSHATLEQMLALSPDKLDEVYEELLKQGLADVVRVRKEIALNPSGLRAVDEIMKKQLESPTL